METAREGIATGEVAACDFHAGVRSLSYAKTQPFPERHSLITL